MTDRGISKAVVTEYEATRVRFHAILDSMSDTDLRKPSLNPGWTNGEILFHMLFGFILLLSLVPMVRVFGRLPKGFSKPLAVVLNLGTIPFNWINGLGPRAGGRVFGRARLGKVYDWVNARLMLRWQSVKAHEWQHGMYYPDHWDALFSPYMTLEKLAYYPTIHFNFHTGQLAQASRVERRAEPEADTH